jgi:hypothetical protein
MPGGPRHVLAIFIEHPRSLSRWAVRNKPDRDVVVMLPASEKLQECYRAGQYIKQLLAKDIKPRYAISIHPYEWYEVHSSQ